MKVFILFQLNAISDSAQLHSALSTCPLLIRTSHHIFNILLPCNHFSNHISQSLLYTIQHINPLFCSATTSPSFHHHVFCWHSSKAIDPSVYIMPDNPFSKPVIFHPAAQILPIKENLFDDEGPHHDGICQYGSETIHDPVHTDRNHSWPSTHS